MKSIEYEIGFSDSEITSYCRSGDGVIVQLVTWNEIPLALTFKDVIALKEIGLGDVADICEADAGSSFLTEALGYLYEDVVDPAHGYHHYLFLNGDDDPALEVVAQSLEINRVDQS